MESITFEQAKRLRRGDYLYHIILRDSRGYPKRYLVTSIKTWKTAPNKIRIGIRHGLYHTLYLNETSVSNFSINTEENGIRLQAVVDPTFDVPEHAALYKWAMGAVRHLPKSERDRLLKAARACILDGGLKGNISDKWREMGHSPLSIPMLLP